MADDPANNDENLTDPRVARRKKLEAIRALGHDPWGGRFENHQSVAAIRGQLDEVVYRTEDGKTVPLPDFAAQPEDFNFRDWKREQGQGELVGPKVRAAGRIVLHRNKGKLHFIDLKDMTGKIQLMVGQKQVGNDWQVVEQLDLGDIIGVDGTLTVSNTGEVSISAERVHFLTKTLDPPPEKHHGLNDPELRQRMRYVDLIHTDGVMDTFLARTRIVRSIRDTLAERDFVEVEGPTLHSIAGGAAARPFNTHHNALDIPLFLRIALELHLKRLLVGGIERVYELGRVYRNEGISPKHNPEFTMLEVYEAYGDYNTMMDLTEACIVNGIKAMRAGPSPSPAEESLVLPWKETTIDFTPPFARKTYDELFAEHTGVDPHDTAGVAALAEKIGFETKGRHPDVIKSDVFEEKVEDALVGPVFVTDYPASICPLTKRKRDNPNVAERFELFIDGMEVANAYTELNDPDLQEELFKTQLDGLSEEDSMAKMDTDFIRALRNGMPPAGGLGIGIDRLVMLLTNSQTIRDVILFPLLRPETS
ncbi:lysine--tRNA ligase [Aeoliella sp. ICT_H6.2]|uniref:Lysine--tRNA ligase n=1 Tax=Aeoliella straminimaris TaxID=2954799 RepID=A0A9X2JIC3_9BACT|nr:lysine--tRNA ligase [Aeoliella straminimaris]MCO6043754.1 lysine--tRNA ligase [Aeoliella straminimaris]